MFSKLGYLGVEIIVDSLCILALNLDCGIERPDAEQFFHRLGSVFERALRVIRHLCRDYQGVLRQGLERFRHRLKIGLV